MSKKLVALLAAVSIVGAVPTVASAVAPPGSSAPVAVAAKDCSRGYTHARIGRKHKCLRRGQYCARRYDRQYHRYGYHCHRRDRNGDYHLS
jgi:hypothetical protein